MRLALGLVLLAAGCTGGPEPSTYPVVEAVQGTGTPEQNAWTIGDAASTAGLTPDPFHFQDVVNAEPGKTYAASALLKGFTGTPFAFVDQDASLDVGGLQTGQEVRLLPGMLTIRMTASTIRGKSKTATVRVDALEVPWTITTAD